MTSKKENKKFDVKLICVIIVIIIIFILCITSLPKSTNANLYCEVEKTKLSSGEVKLTVNAQGKNVNIKTYDNKIVNSNIYEVTVDKNGKYEFYAISGNDSYKCEIDVTDVDSEKKVSKIKLNSSNITLPKDSSYNLKIVAIEPVSASCNNTIWKSSDEEIVTVKNGTIYAHKNGVATVTVLCDQVSATSKITVIGSSNDSIDASINILNIEDSSFEINISTIGNLYQNNPYSWDGINWTNESSYILNSVGANKIYIKNVKQEIKEVNYNVKSLNYEMIVDSNISINDISDNQLSNYESSDLDVVSIDYDGKIYAKKEGKAAISATTTDGEIYIWIFNVIENKKVNDIILNAEEINLPIGTSFSLQIAEVKPETSSCNLISWKSSDENIAIVYDDGTVFAKSSGNAVITVTCDGITAKANVQVVDSSVSPTEITLNAIELNLLEGTSYSLKIAKDPTSSICNKISWTSSNPDIATVENGLVNAKKAGNTIITVQCDELSASANVSVTTKKVNPLMIKLNTSKINLTAGNSYALKISSVLPTNATCSDVSWSSSNNSVASVNDGIVTAKSGGSATVRVKCDGVVASATIIVNNPITFTSSEMEYVKSLVKNSGIPKVQVAVINNGSVVGSYAYNCSESDSFYVSSLSKSVLAITAAKMQQDGLIDLDDLISKHWYNLKNVNFNSYSSDWKKYMGSESAIREYAGKKLVQNPATIRNALTHSSTIKNGNMVHMNPNDHSSEYFEGSMSKTYSRAIFMLSHTYDQLFESGKIPGKTTNYNYLSDTLTREHALAGFTMQVAMKQSINEYLRYNLLSSIGSSTGTFKSGNSIYFAAGYQTSALDLAKLVSVLANDGYYGNKQIFNSATMKELEKIESNLANQSIAFSYINGKFLRYGTFSTLAGASNYGLSDLSKYYSYASYNPTTGNGLVITTYGNQTNAKKLVDSIDSYVYSNS